MICAVHRPRAHRMRDTFLASSLCCKNEPSGWLSGTVHFEIVGEGTDPGANNRCLPPGREQRSANSETRSPKWESRLVAVGGKPDQLTAQHVGMPLRVQAKCQLLRPRCSWLSTVGPSQKVTLQLLISIGPRLMSIPTREARRGGGGGKVLGALVGIEIRPLRIKINQLGIKFSHVGIEISS
jgi:hypothetical protein